jgi:hypothetical protein
MVVNYPRVVWRGACAADVPDAADDQRDRPEPGRGGAFVTKSADAVHGRILRLHATEQGAALLKRCRVRVMEVEGRLLELLDRDEERVVRRWLAAVGNKLSGEG